MLLLSKTQIARRGSLEMPTDREKAILNRNKAKTLNDTWKVGAVQVRYSDSGHWYAQLKKFPAAFFDSNGYILFQTEEEYSSAPMSIGKQVSVPKPGISGMPGYVLFSATGNLQAESQHVLSAIEGRKLLRIHRQLERNRTLAKQKKSMVLKATGKLECEACGFDFHAHYGELGNGFAECHHIIPLWKTGETETRLQDLAIVCSNCHRMLHRRPWHSINEIRSLLKMKKSLIAPQTKR